MIKIGFQACSVTDEFLNDPFATIDAIARCGYRYMESAGTMFVDRLTTPLTEIRKCLESAGIAHVAKHFNSISMENVEKEIGLLNIIGGKQVVLASDFFVNRDAILAQCDLYNRAGKRCAEEGMRFVYHNHAHEFQDFGGKPALEIIVENTDPELVDFEVDTMWAFRGGYDPAEVLKKFGGRVKLLHLGDFHPKYQGRRSFFDGLERDVIITGEFYGKYNIDVATDIGEGIMDIQAILDAANQYSAVEYGFVELSSANSIHKDNMLKAAEFGFNALKKYNGFDLEAGKER